ncbi:MAG TPA: MATE family efflux transporter [Gammaproteobacteria bacterium]|nr:MATE family efflux transporter [Gammaproteobacteria bacterium]
MKPAKAKLTSGPVSSAILSMMAPMIIGLMVLITNSLVDAYFVSQLGSAPLAAVSYAFPVSFIVGAIAMGLGTGTASLASRLFGAGHQEKVRQIATHSMLLGLIAGLCVVIFGLLTLEEIFSLLGADEQTMPFVKDYMEIYYWGGIFLVIPMIGNAVLRAGGDAKTPSVLMASTAVINAVLDPILIFGWFGFPALGIKGAALASVLANVVFLIASLSILIFRENLIQFRKNTVAAILHSWNQILHVGLPAIASNLIVPMSSALVTALISSFGQSAVAAYGLAGRLEAFIIIIFMALGGAIAPFVGQNFGAQKFDRLKQGFVFCVAFSFIYALFCIGFFILSVDTLLGFFTTDPEVIKTAKIQLLYCPWGYGFLGLAVIANGSFNAVGKPMPAMTISIGRTLLVYVPLAYWLASSMGIRGVFIAQVLANLLAGIVGFVWYQNVFKQLRLDHQTI